MGTHASQGQKHNADTDTSLGQDRDQRHHNQTALLSRVTAAAVAVLLVAFFALTINNATTISSQVETIKNGPYPVSVAAGRVETLLVQLRTIVQQPMYLNTVEAADDIRASLDDIDIDMREKLDFIADNHTGSIEDAHKLQDGYDDLSKRQDIFVEMCASPDYSDEEVATYAEEQLYPLIDELLSLDVIVLDESTAAVEEMYTTVNAAISQTIIISVVLMAAVVLSLVFYLFVLHKKSQYEATLRKNLEDALDLAQSASAAKSAFLANMSHDIRTPMNAIIGLTTIASAHLDDTVRVQECLRRISTSSKHLLGLINDVLDMGKIESGKIALNEELFSFPDLISEFIAIIQPQVRAKHLSFDVVIGNVSQEMLIGDTMRLNQILLNLMSNAIKYTPEGGSVKVSINEDPDTRPGFNDYRIVVEDTGIGMEPEFLEHIFDPFERERNDTTNFTEGTGLGMSITKNVVDMMDGTISVESTPGEGSRFTVTVPLKPAPEGEEAFDLSGFNQLRVLVVDDDRDVLENTLLLFDEFGMRGEAADNGLDAVALTVSAHKQNDDFRAIIVDWVMPGIDGIETIRRIRAEVGEATPIILLTAYDWTDIEDEAKDAGVSAFISKPLFKSRLYHVLRTLCLDDGSATEGHDERDDEPLCGRVLLVEDNELNLEIAFELISSLGVEVVTAHDGQEAVDAVTSAEEGQFDLVFMDWQMPHMDGIEATERIIAFEHETERAHTPIVAMTANAFNEDRERALAAGMDGFMAKPIDMSELKRTLREYLAK